ncbi:hypothetical protein BN14_09335 [Rhizoctonia solani AG-1 IB]|uniref:Uncharacterized protein n=1 Tax=Thanatephorus cucumeris (strain AG1-IB / isolate 7/3/14) TaxID=1108050 RepID=M5C828_THACB|nr:hypothetical protein BN14_09335 [Rhizoctonia solani AG-1 IB]
MPTPPSEDNPPRDDVRGGHLMPTSQADLFQSAVVFDTDPLYSTWTANLSSGAGVNLNSRTDHMSNNARESLRLQLTAGAVVDSAMFDEEDDIAAENLELLRMKLLDGLVLDREIESNTISFLVHSFTSWMSRFLFEPARVIPLFREVIVRGHTLGHEKHQRLILTASAVLTVSESTDYDPAPFTDLYNQSVKGVVEARARGSVTREMAIEAMESCHEVISLMCKICPLASILNTMDLYAPIFRLACPEPGHEYVNLPGILTGFQVHLKLYATMDVLLSAVTHRPMFFRYDLDPASPQAEALLNAEDGPGLRWLAGVPDRLIVTLAKMNTLLEDHGNRVDGESKTQSFHLDEL